MCLRLCVLLTLVVGREAIVVMGEVVHCLLVLDCLPHRVFSEKLALNRRLFSILKFDVAMQISEEFLFICFGISFTSTYRRSLLAAQRIVSFRQIIRPPLAN